MFVCTAGDWWRTGLIFDKRFYPTPLQQIKSLVAKSAHVKTFFYQGQQKNWGSIYSPMLDQGWNLLIETLLRTFSFMWIRKEDTKLFFPLLLNGMSHHTFKINQNLFYVHTLDFVDNTQELKPGLCIIALKFTAIKLFISSFLEPVNVS